MGLESCFVRLGYTVYGSTQFMHVQAIVSKASPRVHLSFGHCVVRWSWAADCKLPQCPYPQLCGYAFEFPVDLGHCQY